MKPNYNGGPMSAKTTDPNRIYVINELLKDLQQQHSEMIEGAVEKSGLKDAREHLSRIFGKEVK